VAAPLQRWGVIFLICPIDLDEDQRLSLVRLAARAWFEDLDVLPFSWEGLEGELRTTSEVVSLGSFIGQQFEAQVEGSAGSGRLRFLVTEAQLQSAHLPVAEA